MPRLVHEFAHPDQRPSAPKAAAREELRLRIEAQRNADKVGKA